MKLVVSLHDVSPRTRPVFARMLAEMAEMGVERTSLLVIPDHHHQGHLREDPAFCRWLEALARQGHELVLHGYYHQRPARPGETWWQRGLTRLYTQGEGEFYDLSKAEAADRLARGREDLARLDAPAPVGFIAPAWLLGTEAAEAVREAGFRYTTYLTGVRDLRVPEEAGFIPARSLVYSCRNRWRRAASLLWNAALARRLQGAPLLRLSLHPPDYAHGAVWRQIRRLVGEALRRRQAVTYEQSLASSSGQGRLS